MLNVFLFEILVPMLDEFLSQIVSFVQKKNVLTIFSDFRNILLKVFGIKEKGVS